MRVGLTAYIVTPAARGATSGNRITALRWAKRLRELGVHVVIGEDWHGEPCDVLVALHARKSHGAVMRHAREQPAAPRIVALSGTDIYGEATGDPLAAESIALATRLVALQPLAAARVPEAWRDRVRVIHQSAVAAPAEPQPGFVACALAHLRDVKDPLLAARAAALLPAESRLRVVHLGAADASWAARARHAENARWSWLGPRSRCDSLRVLAGSRLLVLTSLSEGGANVVTEAIAAGTPVLSTRIDGSLGILGDDYPGYFEVSDAEGLAALLARCESDAAFLADLQRRVIALRPLVDPARERAAWQALLDEVM